MGLIFPRLTTNPLVSIYILVWNFPFQIDFHESSSDGSTDNRVSLIYSFWMLIFSQRTLKLCRQMVSCPKLSINAGMTSEQLHQQFDMQFLGCAPYLFISNLFLISINLHNRLLMKDCSDASGSGILNLFHILVFHLQTSSAQITGWAANKIMRIWCPEFFNKRFTRNNKSWANSLIPQIIEEYQWHKVE